MSTLESVGERVGVLRMPENVLQDYFYKHAFKLVNVGLGSMKKLSIMDVGVWNKMEGPDFKNATIRVDDQVIKGDIELHLNQEDWFHHEHHRDPLYGNVVLHVFLYKNIQVNLNAYTLYGYCPYELNYLPYIEDSVCSLVDQHGLAASLAPILKKDVDMYSNVELQHYLESSKQRFAQKVEFIEHQLKTNSIEDIIHQKALEVLGYPRNRQVMLNIAFEYPLARFLTGDIDMGDIFAKYHTEWKLNAVRPHNHPLLRLNQYHLLCRRNPDWINEFISKCEDFNCTILDQKGLLSYNYIPREISDWIELIQSNVFKSIFKNTRFNTLLIDALLPAAAAKLELQGIFNLWFLMPRGDLPDRILEQLKQFPVACNGYAQGLLHDAL